MRRVEVEFKCPCDAKFKLAFKKPHAIEPTFVHTDCLECKSKLFIKFKKYGKDQVTSHLVRVTPSELLKQLIVEQENYNNAPIENET